MVRAAREDKGKAPWIVRCPKAPGEISPQQLEEQQLEEEEEVLRGCGGELLTVPKDDASFPVVLELLGSRGIGSLMVEGGGNLINSILSDHADLVDAIVVTVAPVYLGKGGAQVCPARHHAHEAAVRFCNVKWLPMDTDVVICGRIDRSHLQPADVDPR